MIKKTVTYKDYNGTERTETFYFHFTEAELLDMEMSVEGGFAERVKRIVDAKSQTELLQVIKKFVLDAHGVKSDDGRLHIKNEQTRAEFVQCPAYSKIFMELLTDDKAASEFTNGVVPDDMKEQLAAIITKKNAASN